MPEYGMCINCGNDFGKIGLEWRTDEDGFCICGTCAVMSMEGQIGEKRKQHHEITNVEAI